MCLFATGKAGSQTSEERQGIKTVDVPPKRGDLAVCGYLRRLTGSPPSKHRLRRVPLLRGSAIPEKYC